MCITPEQLDPAETEAQRIHRLLASADDAASDAVMVVRSYLYRPRALGESLRNPLMKAITQLAAVYACLPA